LDGIPGAFTMPRFRGQLSENEVRAVIAYIKTFWTEAERQQQRAMSANFEASYR
jgi:mono/diheme cytochrome c family protein